MSKIVIHGDTIYLSGQVADTRDGDIKTQTQEMLAKVEALLVEAGSDKTKILSATIWLASIGHFAQMNEVWDAWASEGNKPARACTEARLASPDLLVEVSVIAAK
ncbi:MAG: enamine deaminase RidA (YjgF/YER057c/UK114 family) [Saprospiraceae bacterium]|jgi:enamine deaminase RidA (YjgF/YER057c/UK114 family)